MDRSIIIAGIILIASFLGCEPASSHEPTSMWPLQSVTSEEDCRSLAMTEPNVYWYVGNADMGIPSFCYAIYY